LLGFITISLSIMFNARLGAQEVSIREQTVIRGTVVDAQTSESLQNVVVWRQGTDETTVTNEEGLFELGGIVPGRHVLCL
jgi:hypothetical protein